MISIFFLINIHCKDLASMSEKGQARTSEEEQGRARKSKDERGQARTSEDMRGQARTSKDERGRARTSEDVRGHERASPEQPQSWRRVPVSNLLLHGVCAAGGELRQVDLYLRWAAVGPIATLTTTTSVRGRNLDCQTSAHPHHLKIFSCLYVLIVD